MLGLERYDAEHVHRATLATHECSPLVSELLAMSVAERRRLGFMHPGRADVIGAGALVLAGVLRRTGLETLTVSEHDILDGMAGR